MSAVSFPADGELFWYVTADLAYVQSCTASGWNAGMSAYQRQRFSTQALARAFMLAERSRLEAQGRNLNA